MRRQLGFDLLGVFAKHWTPGIVKTRLAVSVGAVAASALYQGFVSRTLERFAAVAETRVVAFWPPEQHAAFGPFEKMGWRIAPQVAGDLGTRMRRFLEDSFAAGAARVVLIGTDSPTLPLEHVGQAFQTLRERPVVLGPAADGGYYLVGAAERVPPIFDGVAWSTPDVWRQTIARLEEDRTPYAVLPEWYDVDDVDDLRRLDRELSLLVKQDAAWRPLWDEVQTAMGFSQPSAETR